MTTISLLADALQTVQTLQLSTGAQLLYKHDPTAPHNALHILTYGGNRLDPVPGGMDMIEDLLSEGTHKRNAEKIAFDLDSLSLDMDTDTRRDVSSFSGVFLADDAEACLEFMGDLLLHSTLADFEKEKIRLTGELTMDLDSPAQYSHDILYTRFFSGTPYQASHHNILKTLETFTDSSLLKTTYQNIFQPANMLFSFVGSMPLETLQNHLAQYFTGSIGQSYQFENQPTLPNITQNEYLTGERNESNQMHVYRAWLAPKASDPDYPAMVVLNCILGGAGLTSRLFLELRDKQGLAYNVRSSYEASQFLGVFSLYIGTEPSNRQKVLTGFDVECQKLIDQLVPAVELAEAKENVLGRRMVYLETANQWASYLASQTALGLKLNDIADLPERIRAVTSQDVQRVAQRVMGSPHLTSAVGPKSAL